MLFDWLLEFLMILKIVFHIKFLKRVNNCNILLTFLIYLDSVVYSVLPVLKRLIIFF